MSWPYEEHCTCPLQSLVSSLLLSFISTVVFSRTGDVLSHLNSSTPQAPSVFTEELVLPRHARCVLSHLRCNGYSHLLSSYLSRIGRMENPSCCTYGHPFQDPLVSLCTVQLRTLYAAHSLATICLSTTSCPSPRNFPGFWGSMVPPCPHPSKGVG